jgi:hypothetical protein
VRPLSLVLANIKRHCEQAASAASIAQVLARAVGAATE